MELANNELRKMEGIEQSLVANAPMLVDHTHFHDQVLAPDNDLALHRNSDRSLGGYEPDDSSFNESKPQDASSESLGARRRDRQQGGAAIA